MCCVARPTGTTVEQIRQIEKRIFIVPLNQSSLAEKLFKCTLSSSADNTARYLLDVNELLYTIMNYA